MTTRSGFSCWYVACLTQANVATGLVNLAIPTMHCGTLVAMLVLGAYTALMLGAAPNALALWPSA